MTLRIKATLLAALLLLSSGCGTMLNLGFGPKPYGGVQADCYMAGEWLTDDQPQMIPLSLFWLCDLPLSLAGDTLSLPYALLAEPGDGNPYSAF